jgi:tetratricopeptide (TPR) repeat protein
MTNLGLLYDKTGDKDSAEECYSKALELRGQIYGESHPLFIRIAQLLISFYEKTDRGGKAAALRRRIGGNAAE